MTGETWAGGLGGTGNCHFIDSNDRCGPGHGVSGVRADGVAQLGGGGWGWVAGSWPGLKPY